MKIAYFLNPYKKVLSVIPSFLINVYIKKNYYLLPNNKVLRNLITFFYIKILRKFLIIIELIKKVKIIWINPKEFEYIIFDDQSLGVIDKILPSKNFFVITSRIDSFRNIYLTKEIVKYIFKNIFNNSIKINYIMCLIKLIKPKKIITLIDNSVDFHIIYKLLHKSDISFYAIQNAFRNEIYLKNIFSISNYSGNYFCFGDYEINSIKNNISYKSNLRLKAIGSIKIELAKEYILKNNKKIDEIYDICLISEAMSEIGTSGGSNYSQYTDFQKIQAKLLRYTLMFCEKYDKKLLFLGRNNLKSKNFQLNKEEEYLFYKFNNQVKDFNLQFFDKSNYQNIKHLLQSKVIIGNVSTLLRESFGLKKKILVCDWENKNLKKDFNSGDFPGDGILKLQSQSFIDFEKRLLEILDLDFNQYLSKTINQKQIYNLNFKTLQFLREEMKR